MNDIDFSANKKDLRAAFDVVSKCVKGRISLPILGCIHVQKNNDGVIQFMSTNLEMWVSHVLPASACLLSTSQSGTFALPSQTFGSALATLPEGSIDISGSKKDENSAFKVRLSVGKTKFSLLALDSDQFPTLPVLVPLATLKLTAGEFKRVLTETIYAASHDATRMALCGLLFRYVEPLMLQVVATDTHRLAISAVEVKGVGCSFDAIIPTDAAREALRLAGGDKDGVEIVYGDNQLQFTFENTKLKTRTTIVSRVIDGVFPDFNRVVPSEAPDFETTINREHLIAGVQRVATIATEQGSANRMLMNFTTDSLVLSAISDASGTIEDVVPLIDILVGPKEVLAANCKYFLETLNSLTSETLTLQFTAPLRPFVVIPDGHPNHKAIIMPMQVI